ncbi:hypothetical protein SAMD00019534_063840 [Acytostelium subglobosum LB1]|uniref:hypothetical protein n=1 Tax=Acytostelium subglobosum LB1 TaxID=1410327 RepID=UPI000644DDD8|nr:hypothetical protein SAMD00019534_063840 [Acytostelium subglobosum LB1]GAM23209.1 hypothetical protein SAMD00019534_063840 [Acytostelium subglobosum LB1]|eukprot:XP_012753658.1 hypothetical protein SAMD00019534_063840 [Acytostelium subglobosum LB1]
MGNAPSQDALFKINGRALSAFYDHKKVGTVVATKTSLLYFNDRTKQLIKTVPTKKPLSYIIYNRELDLFITGEDDFTIRIYKASDGTYINCLPSSSNPTEMAAHAHRDLIKQLLFMDDRSLLSGSTDGSIRLWNIASGQMQAMFMVASPTSSVVDVATSSVTSIVFDHKRSLLIVGSSDGIIRKFSYENRNIIGQFEGHSRGAILNLAISNNGNLISSSMDRTIRVWDIDTGATLVGAQYFAQVLIYDSYRDILFAGNDLGTVAVVKIEVDNTTSKRKLRVASIDCRLQGHTTNLKPLPLPFSLTLTVSFKKLNVLDFKLQAAILHVDYNTYADTMSVTTIDSTIGFLTNVTGIQNDKDLETNEDHHVNDNDDGEDDDLAANEDDETDPLSQEAIDAALRQVRELETAKDKMHNHDNKNIDPARIKILSQLGGDLFGEDDEISTIRKKKYIDGMEQILRTQQELSEEFVQSVDSILCSKLVLAALHGDSARLAKEMEVAQRRQEILDRHKRELEQFQRETDDELKNFDEVEQPRSGRTLAKRYLARTEAYRQGQHEVETSLTSHISTSFHLVGDRFHIGQLISPSATNVFSGFDAQALTPVAIKVLPPGITIGTEAEHRYLTKIITTFANDKATYVILEPCSMDITQFVEEFENQLLPLELVKTIIFQLLECLAYLHSHKMVKREITPSSVLIGADNSVRLTHLGVMKSLTGRLEEEPTVEEGSLYGAPELFCRVITTESDMWAVGCFLVYLLQNEEERQKRPLFDGASDLHTVMANIVKVVGRPSSGDVAQLVEKCHIDQEGNELLQFAVNQPVPLEDPIDVIKHHISRRDANDAIDLIQHLLQFIPSQRVTAQRAMTHRLFTNTGPTSTPTPTPTPTPEVEESNSIVGATPVLTSTEPSTIVSTPPHQESTTPVTSSEVTPAASSVATVEETPSSSSSTINDDQETPVETNEQYDSL